MIVKTLPNPPGDEAASMIRTDVPGFCGVGLLGSRCGRSVELLVLGGYEHAQDAVSSSAVVEGLEVLELGVGKLDVCSLATSWAVRARHIFDRTASLLQA